MRRPALRLAAAVAITVVLVIAAGGLIAVEDSTTRIAPHAPRVLWGIGDELGPALGSSLYRQGIAGLVMAWFNGPRDLDWMRESDGTEADRIYAAGGTVELVVWLDDDPGYAISERFQSDIRVLTRIHKGSGPHPGPLYVVLFTEFETYHHGDPAYQATLMTAYRRAVEAFAPAAVVEPLHVRLQAGVRKRR